MIEKDSGLSDNTLLGISEGLDLVFLSDSELLVQFGTRSRPSQLLRDTDITGILRKTVGRLLEGPASLHDLLSCLGPKDQEEGQTLLTDLVSRGIVTELHRSPVEQYLRYTLTGQPTALGRTVSIIGNGPIGVRLAHSLLLHGVDRLVLLDDRKVDDLWTALLPLGHELAKSRLQTSSELLGEVLHEAGYPHVEVLAGDMDFSGLEAAVMKSDFCVLALEQARLRSAHLLNRICIRERKPWMLASTDGNFGLVGPLFLPVHTACFNDYQVLGDSNISNMAMFRKHRQYTNNRPSSFFTGLPSYAEVVAGFSSMAIVDFLLRETSFALGRVMVIDFNTMAIEIEDVLKLPRCPVCGREKSVYRPPFTASLLTQSSESPGLSHQGSEAGHEP